MFLSREIDIKLCQNYTKLYIYKISYKSCSIKQNHIQQLRNQSENYYIPQPHRSLRISDLLLYNFAFLIDIIDNIITYSLYTLYYVTRTSTNDSAVSLSRVSRDQYTALAEVL